MPIPLLFVAGLGVSAVWAATILALNAGKVVVPRVAEWAVPPDVLIEPVLADLLPIVQEAVRKWEKLGHEFGTVRVRVVGDHDEGCIVVSPIVAGWRHTNAMAAAQALAYFGDTSDEVLDPNANSPEDSHEISAADGRMITVRILWDRGATDGFEAKRIMAHELGHAIGYLHCTARLGRKRATSEHVRLQIPKTGHLMNPQYADGGWSMQGLEADGLDDHRDKPRRRARR